MNAPFRVLRSYQQRAATFLYESDSAFLVAPLGAGKGAAALTAGAELIRDGHRRHAFVIAPKLVAETVWPQEVAAWAHLRHLRVAVLDGNPERRRALLATAAERQLTVIGIDLVPWLVNELASVPADHPLFDLLVIDETSRLKDPSGKRARALLRIAGRFKTRWGLTGTPRPNSAMDLFMPAAILTDGALWGRAFIPWQKRHFRPRDPFGREWRPLPGAEAKIAAEFGTVAMTVSNEDMPDLPPLNIVVALPALPKAAMTAACNLFEEIAQGAGLAVIKRIGNEGKRVAYDLTDNMVFESEYGTYRGLEELADAYVATQHEGRTLRVTSSFLGHGTNATKCIVGYSKGGRYVFVHDFETELTHKPANRASPAVFKFGAGQ